MRRSALLVSAAFALVAVSACKIEVEPGAAASGAASPSASVPVSASASPSEGTIPTAALLQPADLGGESMKPVEGDTGEALRPPRPCGTPHPSDAARIASTAMTALHPSAGGGESTAPSVILQTIVRYKPGSGAQAFADLTAAVSRCPGKAGPQTREWKNLGPVDAGAETVLFSTTTQVRGEGETTPAPWNWPFAVARVGDDLVLVADLGWEASSGDEALVRTLITAAVKRAKAAS